MIKPAVFYCILPYTSMRAHATALAIMWNSTFAFEKAHSYAVSLQFILIYKRIKSYIPTGVDFIPS